VSFLDDLKQQAQARQAQLRGDHAVIEHNVALVEAACAVVWRYLDDLGRQLDVLQPASPQRYAIDPRAVVEGLRYTAFGADLRRKRVERGPLSAPEWVDYIVLTARLVSGQSFELTKDFPPEIERLEARLAQAGIRCLGEPERDPVSSRFLCNRYRFTADLVAGVRVMPLHEQGRLQFNVQNLDGLATVKATFAAHQMTTERLDELAKWWMGQPHRFLDGALEVQRTEPW
jgi:hypothetical protein